MKAAKVIKEDSSYRDDIGVVMREADGTVDLFFPLSQDAKELVRFGVAEVEFGSLAWVTIKKSDATEAEWATDISLHDTERSSFDDAIEHMISLRHSHALDSQVGGQHYKNRKIQSMIFHRFNNIGHAEGNAIDYIIRAKEKNGLEDLKKAIHYIKMIARIDYGEEIQ